MGAEVTVVQLSTQDNTYVDIQEAQATVIQAATASIRLPAFDVVVSPLMYDYDTDTLSIDQSVLNTLVVGFTRYVHDQPTPSATWTVTHNLGYFPGGASVVDSAGSVCYGDVVHQSVNSLVISFAVAFSGKAYLS